MRGFAFRLEPLLSLRRHREQMLQVQLAESQRVMEAETVRLEAIRREIEDQARQSTRHHEKGPLDMEKLNLESSYLAVLERRLESQEALVDKLSRRVAEEREAVLQASREKKALERLRETLLLAFAREEARKELKDAEEVATTQHVRRQREQEGFAEQYGR